LGLRERRVDGTETAGQILRYTDKGPHAMQVFHETVKILDPLLPPTPSQRVLHAYLSGGEEALAKEYEAMHPSNPASSETKKASLPPTR
jgi:hypothetical protein